MNEKSKILFIHWPDEGYLFLQKEPKNNKVIYPGANTVIVDRNAVKRLTEEKNSTI
ncbi:hypothetical protein [Chryseobacterium sp. Marseille-Q3244]|uniref:hypothetical protein n=1 Tax=Chryseobacterium sp. Marseille-Q3244 TaxID=2758092 RepID=UPI0020250797|nr:hypothetical protein [Chryseobacterium sp. Marseille-Q3244]